MYRGGVGGGVAPATKRPVTLTSRHFTSTFAIARRNPTSCYPASTSTMRLAGRNARRSRTCAAYPSPAPSSTPSRGGVGCEGSSATPAREREGGDVPPQSHNKNFGKPYAPVHHMPRASRLATNTKPATRLGSPCPNVTGWLDSRMGQALRDASRIACCHGYASQRLV